jgi:hypothetical protein
MSTHIIGSCYYLSPQEVVDVRLESRSGKARREAGLAMSYDTAEEQVGRANERVVKLLIEECFGVQVDILPSGTKGDDDYKIDLLVHTPNGVIPLQVKSSAYHATKHVATYHVPTVWLDSTQATHRNKVVDELVSFFDGELVLCTVVLSAREKWSKLRSRCKSIPIRLMQGVLTKQEVTCLLKLKLIRQNNDTYVL